MAVEVLSSLRHDCTACGGSCQGSFAYMLNQEEHDRVVRFGAELGIEDPIEDGHLRQKLGRCVFLMDDNLCRIHKEHGLEAKPTVCKQYPMVALRTETGLRAGVDPGCYSVIETWKTADEIDSPNLVAHKLELPAPQVAWEQAFLDRTDGDEVRVADLLQMLTGKEPDGTGLPAGFAARLVTRLQRTGLELLLDLPDTPVAMRSALYPVAEAIGTWDPDAPPTWNLGPEEEVFAVDVVRRMVHLRLGAQSIPAVAGVALLTVSGVVAAAWTNPDPLPFGQAVAAWCRGIRVRPFWMSIVPDAAAMQGLATG